MKQKELEIISHLRKDARSSLAAISNDVEIPISTIYDKVNRMHKGDVIKRFTTLVDFSKLGYHHHATIAIRVPKKQKRELFLFLKNENSINTLHEINNGFDFLIETIHINIKEYSEFIEELQESFNILELNKFQIIKEIERERFNCLLSFQT